MIQKGVNPVDQPVAHGVFHVLGLFMDFVPGKMQSLDQEQLDKPVPPHDAQCQRIAGRGQPHSFVGRVGGQVAFAQCLQHAGDRARRDREGKSNLARSSRFAPVGCAELVYCFDVVFNSEARQAGT